MKILGIHGGVTNLQNEASATLLVDGKVSFASEEERYMRIKGALACFPSDPFLRAFNIAI